MSSRSNEEAESVSERIISRNISHSKFKKKIKKLYNRNYITKENYDYLMFQRSVFEMCGNSVETWKYLLLETHDRFGVINRENIESIIQEWIYNEC